jgi:hypothetical protein
MVNSELRIQELGQIPDGGGICAILHIEGSGMSGNSARARVRNRLLFHRELRWNVLNLITPNRKPSAVIVVSTKLTIRCRPLGQSAIYNLQSEMPLCRTLTPLRNNGSRSVCLRRAGSGARQRVCTKVATAVPEAARTMQK